MVRTLTYSGVPGTLYKTAELKWTNREQLRMKYMNERNFIVLLVFLQRFWLWKRTADLPHSPCKKDKPVCSGRIL